MYDASWIHFPQMAGLIIAVMLRHHVVFIVDGKCQVSAPFRFKERCFPSKTTQAEIRQSRSRETCSSTDRSLSRPECNAAISVNPLADDHLANRGLFTRTRPKPAQTWLVRKRLGLQMDYNQSTSDPKMLSLSDRFCTHMRISIHRD